MCGFITGLFILSHWSLCLSLGWWQFGSVNPPTIFFFKIVLVILHLHFHKHLNFTAIALLKIFNYKDKYETRAYCRAAPSVRFLSTIDHTVLLTRGGTVTFSPSPTHLISSSNINVWNILKITPTVTKVSLHRKKKQYLDYWWVV